MNPDYIKYFQYQCYRGNVAEVKAMLSRVSDPLALVNDTVANPFYGSALHAVCRGDSVELLEYLLDLGATVDSVAHYKDTPLHIACYLGKIQMAMILVSKGANMHAENIWKETPYSVAAGKKIK